MTGSLFDLLTLVGAIAFLVLILQWRALLAMPLRTQSARPSQVDLSRALAMDDLLPPIAAELGSQGFTGPHWYTLEQDPPQVRGMAVFSHADGTQLFLLPMFVLENPNRCVTYLVSELADGRRAVSQLADPYFELTRVEGELAQTLKPTTLTEALGAHRTWVAQHGAAVPVSAATRLALMGEWLSQRRQSMIAAGMAETASDGITRFRLGFSWKALRAFWSRPKWPANQAPVPLNRLTLIAQMAHRARQNMPRARNQWLIFALSVLLFVGLGWHFFGLQFALILMLVIGVHELGHYLAMLAFGYRNVHMLALPLVGGVTIGQEAHPDALHRAWMSLMGPLPGLLIGWAMLIWMVIHDPSQLFRPDQPLTLAMYTFLLVNYLNILPFLPLDGGHIVQAMLPPRWYLIRIGFVLLGAGLGIAFGLFAGLVGIAILAGLQLLGLGTQWQTRKAVLDLSNRGESLQGNNPARKLRVALEALERVAGPPSNVGVRINQAEDVVRTLDVRGLSLIGGLATAGTYLSMLISPLLVAVALGLYAGLSQGIAELAPNQLITEMQDQINARVAKEDRRLREEASDLTMMQLLNALSINEPEPVPGPASADAIAATEERLGATLPEALHEFYSQNNGHPALGILPVEEIRRVRDMEGDPMLLDEPTLPIESVDIEVSDPEGEYEIQPVSKERVRDWVYLGGFQSDDLILLDLAPEPAIRDRRLINYFFESSHAYPGLLAFLREQYQQGKISDYYEIAQQEVLAERLSALSALSDDALLDLLPKPSLTMMLLSGSERPGSGADAAEIQAFEAEHQVKVPASLSVIYQRHNGWPVAGLVPLSQVQPVTAELLASKPIAHRFDSAFRLIQAQNLDRRLNLSQEDLQGCLHMSRFDPPQILAEFNLVWCDKPRHPDVQLVDLHNMAVYASWRDYLLMLAAEKATLATQAAEADSETPE